MANTNGSEKVNALVDSLQRWQKIERQAVSDTNEIAAATPNPLVRMIMEIIGHDSLMHHRVQQFIIDSVTKQAVPIRREDVVAIWDKIEAHDKVERRSIELAEELREQAWDPMHKQLLDYLLSDEKKHDLLIDGLQEIKRGMNLASGG
jgi:hypothetical protein